MLRLAIVLVGLAVVAPLPSFAQTVLDPGVALRAPGGATLNALAPMPNLPVGPESEKTWSLKHGDAAPFYYARYTVSEDTRTNKGTASAGSDLYGVYYNAGNGASKRDGDWVVEPEWSGLFPLTTDSMLVRASGTDTWYILQTRNGGTKKLGEGQIGSAEIVDIAVTGGVNLFGNEFYYLITADDGARQTIRLMEWEERKQAFSLGDPIDNVVPAAVLGESPVKVTLKRDSFVRRYDPDGSVYDFRIYRTSPPPSKTATELSYRTTVAVTSPNRQMLQIRDAEEQLYVPSETVRGLLSEWSDIGGYEQGRRFLGVRPIGNGITTGLKDNPLESLPNELMAAVWKMPSGVRLAPLEVHWQGYKREYDLWGSPNWESENFYYSNYGGSRWIRQSGDMAKFVAMYPVDIPEDVRRHEDATLAWFTGVYGVYPNGAVDVFVVRTGFNYGGRQRVNRKRLADMDAARAFMAQAITLEGRKAFHAYYLELREEYLAKMAEGKRQEEARKEAAIQAMYDREAAARQGTTDAIRARLDSGDFYGAMTLASNGGGADLPWTLVYIMRAGRSDMISLNMAQAGLQYASEDEAGWINGRIKELRPAPAGTFRVAPSSSSSSSSSSNSQGQILQDAQQRSRDSYNSGNTGSYLCGAASFCN